MIQNKGVITVENFENAYAYHSWCENKSGKVERVKLPVEIWQKIQSGHLSMILQRKLKASL
jgi:hypothetical protein